MRFGHLLIASLAVTVPMARAAAQSVSRPPILSTPAKAPVCTVEHQRAGRDSVRVAMYSYITRARGGDRDIHMIVDTTGQVLVFSDMQSHPAPGDTARSTVVVARFGRAGAAGVVSVVNVSRADVERKMLANDLRLPPMTPEETQRAQSEQVALTPEELDRVRALAAWLLDQRATCEAPRR